MKKIKLILFSFIICSLLSGICEAQWVQVLNGTGNNITASALAFHGNNIFAGISYPISHNGVYISTNDGASWIRTSLNNRNISAITVNGNNIYAATNGVFLSTDDGTSWIQTTLNNPNVLSLAVNGNNVFAGTYGNGVYLSANNGSTWTQTSLNNRNIKALTVNGNYIFAGAASYNFDTATYGVYKSSDNGTTWAQTSLNHQSIFSLANSGNNIFAGTSNTFNHNGVFLSVDNGITWTQSSLNNQDIYSLIVNGNNIFAGAGIQVPYSFYLSTNNGINWVQRSDGLPSGYSIISLCIFNNFIFAGSTHGVYRRQLSELVGIQPISNEVPNQFSLSQNYPNPFNPTTKIRFALPKSSFAILVVYDLLGREMETLVSEQLNAGTYEADWNADKFSSGIYYYKLVAGDFVETKKMVLIK